MKFKNKMIVGAIVWFIVAVFSITYLLNMASRAVKVAYPKVKSELKDIIHNRPDSVKVDTVKSVKP